MKINKFFSFGFLFLFCFALSFLNAEIIECQNLEEAVPFLEESTLVAFEIDEVLLKSDPIVGRTSFFDLLKEEALDEGQPLEKISERLYPLWVEVQKKAPMALVSPQVKEFLNVIQEKELSSFIVTHRGPELVYTSFDQIRAADLDFGKHEDFELDFINKDILYYQGLLAVHPNVNKTNAFLNFLDEKNLFSPHILFVDTSLVHLVEMENALEEKGIEFTGIYLRNSSDFLTEREIEIGKLQLNYIHKLLPDCMAQALFSKNYEEAQCY